MSFLLFLALVGHTFLWIGLVNRLHAVGIRRWIIKSLTLVFFLCAGLIFLGIVGQHVIIEKRPATGPWINIYVILCWCVLAATLLRLVYFRCVKPLPALVRFHGRRRVEINPATAIESAQHFATRLPLNEILQLEVTEWVLDVPRLPPALDGLSIVHLSDLHLTGRIGKAYFREVVRTCNELKPDLVCITGDIVDRAACFDWLPDTLGQLAARDGVYFILGNHDRKVDFYRLRHILQECGLVDLGGWSLQIEINDTPLVLTGNERPWFDGSRDVIDCVPDSVRPHDAVVGRSSVGPFQIALAHTSDQLAWARANHADLMLAGHTHGGQIRIPPFGAIFSPTFTGVKYISGVFHLPPTILHVTRGLSGDTPVRWNCRPEVAHLKLRACAITTPEADRPRS
jgi:uncharacterized protein